MRGIGLISIVLLLVVCCQNGHIETDRETVGLPSSANMSVDSLLRQELELITVEDQTLRLLLPDVTEKFGRDSKEHAYIWTLINRQDSICIEKVVSIIEKYGWVGKSRVGSVANQGIWLVIQHAEVGVQEKYLPLLQASVEAGESEGWHQAYLEDRILMYQDKKQRFGTQAKWDQEAGKNRIHPIEDVEHVNARREKLGLEPIEQYAKTYGYLFDPEDLNEE